MTMMLIDSENFRRRCASALTHPVTLAALVALLLNDGLFKSLWPDSWVTGKLSDLAWVVFASPLLAFVLSLFLSRRLFGRRAAIVTAYAGLPALYVAFNTFEPVHERVVRGLSLVSGGTAGSPIDPSDSLVIPFGLGIAVWVWRRPAVSSDRLRVRLALLAAGMATFATVATSAPPPLTGVRSVGVAGDGAIMAAADEGKDRSQYSSSDGGLTWEPYAWPPNIVWVGEDVETPRGNLLIRGSDIMVLTLDGDWEAVYSAAYLQEESNAWIQEQTTTQFGPREIGTKPYSIAYDARTGNLVVAMGLQGIVVGTPNGQWSRVAVGDYSPTDFSIGGKAIVLISNIGLWATTLCLSLSMTAFSLVLAQYRREATALGIGVTLAVFALLIGLPYLLGLLELHEGTVVVLVLLACAVIGSAISLKSEPKDSRAMRGIALGVASASGIISIVAGGILLLFFGASIEGPSFFIYLLFTTLTLLFAFVAMLVFWRQLRPGKAVLSAFAGMNGLTVLVFLMWVQLGFGLTFAKISAFVLVALVAIALTNHLKRKQQPGGHGLDQGAKKT